MIDPGGRSNRAAGPFRQAVLIANHLPRPGIRITAIGWVCVKALTGQFGERCEPTLPLKALKDGVLSGRCEIGKGGPAVLR